MPAMVDGGKKRVGRYLLDGYDKETNTAYEMKSMDVFGVVSGSCL